LSWILVKRHVGYREVLITDLCDLDILSVELD
jgi:hypothetical protein